MQTTSALLVSQTQAFSLTRIRFFFKVVKILDCIKLLFYVTRRSLHFLHNNKKHSLQLVFTHFPLETFYNPYSFHPNQPQIIFIIKNENNCMLLFASNQRQADATSQRTSPLQFPPKRISFVKSFPGYASHYPTLESASHPRK